MIPDDLPGHMFTIAAGFVGDGDIDATLTRLCHVAVDAIAGCDFAGITLVRDGMPQTTAFTDPLSPEIDTAQYVTGSGPCLDAFRDDVSYAIEDTRTETRWPDFARAADQHGIRSTLSMPLNVGDHALGALNMYAIAVGSFSNDDRDMATLFAAQAAAILANAQAYWAAHALSQQLQEALASRAVIEQAKGILMARHTCDADAAFDLLVRASQDLNVKVRTLAQDVVQTGQLPAQNQP